MMAVALVASPGCPGCCLQLRLLRRPHPAPPRLRLLHLSSARLRLCAGPPTSDSFAGWSDREQDDDDKVPPQSGGILGPGLAGFFFLAALTFAVSSTRSNNGTRVQMHNLPADTTAMETYSDGSHQHQLSLLTADPQCEKGTNELSMPLETDPEGEAERQKEQIETISSHVISEEAHQFDASDGTASPPLSAESEQVAYAPSSKLDEADPSKGIPNLEGTLDSRVALSEKCHLHETTMSDVVALDSDDAVPIQQISDSAANDRNIQQNTEDYVNDESSPSLFSHYVEHESANMMSPLSLNDLPTESSKPGDEEEILAGGHDERENELEDQSKLLKSISPGQSFSVAGIPAPLSSASHVTAGQIVIPATFDPTQENALSALQTLKEYFL